jgi:glutaredoxin-like YruB-family protein
MNVTLYFTPTCPYCRMAKEYLAKKNIPYTGMNVAESRDNAQEMIKKSGQMGVPVIDVDGKIIVGFDEKELNKAFGK